MRLVASTERVSGTCASWVEISRRERSSCREAGATNRSVFGGGCGSGSTLEVGASPRTYSRSSQVAESFAVLAFPSLGLEYRAGTLAAAWTCACSCASSGDTE